MGLVMVVGMGMQSEKDDAEMPVGNGIISITGTASFYHATVWGRQPLRHPDSYLDVVRTTIILRRVRDP